MGQAAFIELKSVIDFSEIKKWIIGHIFGTVLHLASGNDIIK